MDARRRRGKSRLNQQKLMRHFFSPISSSSIGKREREKKNEEEKQRHHHHTHIEAREKCLWVMWSEGSLFSLTFHHFSLWARKVCAEWGTFKSGWARRKRKRGVRIRSLSLGLFFFLLSLVYVFHFLLRVKRWTVENQWGEQPGISVPISLPRCSCFFFSFFLFHLSVLSGCLKGNPLRLYRVTNTNQPPSMWPSILGRIEQTTTRRY